MLTKHCGCNFVVAQMKSALKLCTKAKFGDLLLTLAKAPSNPHCVLIWQMNSWIWIIYCILIWYPLYPCHHNAHIMHWLRTPCWNLNWVRTFWSKVHSLDNFRANLHKIWNLNQIWTLPLLKPHLSTEPMK